MSIVLGISLVLFVARTPKTESAKLPYRAFFLDITLPELIGKTCLGHILGAATILGLHGTNLA